MPVEHPTQSIAIKQWYQCARCGHKWARSSKPYRCPRYPCRTTQWESNNKRKPETHGHGSQRNRSKTYNSWAGMIQRGFNPNSKRFKDYGGRGISVCNRWRNSFAAFLADMGERPDGTTLDRYPNKDGNYEPGNCRWATPKEQQNNTRNNWIIEFNGISKTIHEWATSTGIKASTLRRRITSNWPLEQVFGLPLMQGFGGAAREVFFQKKANP